MNTVHKEPEQNGKSPVNLILLIGLGLYGLYVIVNRFVVEIPDLMAYPWMIVSCICMLIGIYQVAKDLGTRYKK